MWFLADLVECGRGFSGIFPVFSSSRCTSGKPTLIRSYQRPVAAVFHWKLQKMRKVSSHKYERRNKVTWSLACHTFDSDYMTLLASNFPWIRKTINPITPRENRRAGLGGNLLRSYGVLREFCGAGYISSHSNSFTASERKNRVFVVFKSLILSVCREAMRTCSKRLKESESRTKTVIKFSKWSRWPALEINVKQGAELLRTAGVQRSSCAWHWKFGRRKILSFVICMQIPLLHKLTFEPRVSPHLGESRVTDRLLLYCGWWESNAALRTKRRNKTSYWVNMSLEGWKLNSDVLNSRRNKHKHHFHDGSRSRDQDVWVFWLKGEACNFSLCFIIEI